MSNGPSLFRRVAVVGGTGFVGTSVCERLVRRLGGGGGRTAVPTRRLAHGQSIRFLPTVDLIETDVHDEAQLERALAGCEAVIQLVAILHGTQENFQHVHVELPRKLARVCQRLGVRRVIHVSALGVGADAPSRYLRSKAEGEAALQEAGLDLSIVRPSVIFGTRDRFTNLFASMLSVAPFMPLAGAQARFQPVWVEDVAEALVRCLDNPATIGQTLEAAGPQVMTLAEIVSEVGTLSACPRPVWPLPKGLAHLQAALMELLPGEPLMSRDNLDSMEVPNVASGVRPDLQSLGIEPASLAAVGPTWLAPAAGSGPARLDAYRSRHR